MCANSNLEERITLLESQNEELKLKIKQLEKFFDNEKYKRIESLFKEPPGQLYLESHFTLNKINKITKFIEENKTEIDKIRFMLEECCLFILSGVIKFQMMDLSRNIFNEIFGKRRTAVHEKELHQLFFKCFDLFQYTQETNEIDPDTLLQKLKIIKERLEHEYHNWNEF